MTTRPTSSSSSAATPEPAGGQGPATGVAGGLIRSTLAPVDVSTRADGQNDGTCCS